MDIFCSEREIKLKERTNNKKVNLRYATKTESRQRGGVQEEDKIWLRARET